jgi:hypothetical protein
MTNTSSHVYQSGETVPVTGVYEVVGVDNAQPLPSTSEEPIRDLIAGEVFPDYDGRAVTWHLQVGERDRYSNQARD